MKVWVVWDTIRERIVAVFNSEEKAAACCQERCDKDRDAGVQLYWMAYEYDEYEVQ